LSKNLYSQGQAGNAPGLPRGEVDFDPQSGGHDGRRRDIVGETEILIERPPDDGAAEEGTERLDSGVFHSSLLQFVVQTARAPRAGCRSGGSRSAIVTTCRLRQSGR
jgi:hypothetical protein